MSYKAKIPLQNYDYHPSSNQQAKNQRNELKSKEQQGKSSEYNLDCNYPNEIIFKRVLDNLKTGLALFNQKLEVVYNNKFIKKQININDEESINEKLLQLQIIQVEESKNKQSLLKIPGQSNLNCDENHHYEIADQNQQIEIQLNPNIKSSNLISTQNQFQSQKRLGQQNLDCRNSILINDEQILNRKNQSTQKNYNEKLSSLKQQIIPQQALEILKRNKATTLQDLIQGIFFTQEKNELQRFRSSSRLQQRNDQYQDEQNQQQDHNNRTNIMYFEDKNDIIIILQDQENNENRIQWLKVGLYLGKRTNLNSEYFILIEYFDNTALLKSINQNEIFEYKNRMLASVSHELRTPLNCSIQMLQLLVQNFEQDNIDVQEVLETIVKPALNSNYILLNIINDILDFAQINSGDFQLTFTPLSLFELVTECIDMVCHQAALKGIQIDVQFDSNLPEQIHSDLNRIRQVILNLLCNSLKFTQKGNIRIIFALESPKLIRVDVSDTGCGIPEDNLKNIFQTFGNKLNAKYLNTKGAGFGLSITNNLAMGLGGNRKMMVKSKVNEGSTFSFYIIDRDLNKTGCKYKLKDIFNQQIIKWESCTKIESKSNFAHQTSRQNILNIMKSFRISQEFQKSKPDLFNQNSVNIENSQFLYNITTEPLEGQLSKQYSKQSTITLSLVPKKVLTNSKSSFLHCSSFNNNSIIPSEGSFLNSKIKSKCSSKLDTFNLSNQKTQEYNNDQILFSQKSKEDLIFQQSFIAVDNQLEKKIESCQILEENSSLNFNIICTNSLQLRNQYFKDCESPLQILKDQIIQEQAMNDSLFSSTKMKKSNQKTRMLQEIYTINSQKLKQEKEQKVNNTQQQLNKLNADKTCECSQILIVDDNDFNLFSLQLVLKTFGFYADKSSSGLEAIQKIKLRYNNQQCCQNYKLIFMDIDMPVMDGHQTTTEIFNFYNEQQSSTKPVISACSAFVQDSEKQKAFQNGMKYYITKPINIKQLEQTLANEFLYQNKCIK